MEDQFIQALVFLLFLNALNINLSTEEIIAGCKSGDRKCQDALVREYASVLMAICMRYTKDKAVAQDALQETFINVFKYLNSYNASGSFDGWIKRIAVNCSLTFIKKLRAAYYADEIDDRVHQQQQVPDVYSSLAKEDVIELLKELPPSMYTIFNLCIIEGYNHSDVSELLNISERTSRATLSRARARLIEIMKREENLENIRLNSML